jgi:trafficking protein particle complex subunit 10
LSWFGNLIPESSSLRAETSLPLLSVDKKSYRDLILANTISVFDFRVYLLARQCNLLGKMGRVVYVAKKVVTFLGAFGCRLREVSVSFCFTHSDNRSS